MNKGSIRYLAPPINKCPSTAFLNALNVVPVPFHVILSNFGLILAAAPQFFLFCILALEEDATDLVLGLHVSIGSKSFKSLILRYSSYGSKLSLDTIDDLGVED